ncbi:insulinase family protein [Shewanella olleyana]|uniref:M16 family metallopeptidase n=1 Tax=Shewanella olleyana TaxID=135626 RepID=UPI00200D7A7A|nr:insulinase family protein [Shewanella olleyana]MCL1065998.1 insulinase family protein [Shewanella olleyana]
MRQYLTRTICIFSLILMGCQHSPINFTESQPPNTPKLTQLANAPVLQPLSSSVNETPSQKLTSIRLSSRFTSHHWTTNQSTVNKSTVNQSAVNKRETDQETTNDQSLNSIYFIGVSPHSALESPDVLIEAFSQRRAQLANQQQSAELIACYDSIRFRASLHSMAITMQCSANLSQMQKVIMDFWQNESFNNINLETVQRNLKLNKHIGAFTGSEIDQVFRQQLLGADHPYNLNINNQELINELVKTNRLQQLHIATRDKLQWHLFTRTSKENNDSFTENKNDWPLWLIQDSANVSSEPNQDLTAANNPASSVETTPTIYIIDAPDTVQTQVRIGFVTNNNTIGCKTISPLLGRGYSGRLFYDLREVRGLTYGVYGRCIDAPLSQYLFFYGSTALENSGAFLQGILDHTKLLTEQKVSQAEIDSVATYLIGRRLLSLDTTFGHESDYIRHVLAGKTAKQAQEQINAISQLTPEQLLQLSIETFSSQPTIVLRGDADKMTQDIRDKLPNWQIKPISAN